MASSQSSSSSQESFRTVEAGETSSAASNCFRSSESSSGIGEFTDEEDILYATGEADEETEVVRALMETAKKALDQVGAPGQRRAEATPDPESVGSAASIARSIWGHFSSDCQQEQQYFEGQRQGEDKGHGGGSRPRPMQRRWEEREIVVENQGSRDLYNDEVERRRRQIMDETKDAYVDLLHAIVKGIAEILICKQVDCVCECHRIMANANVRHLNGPLAGHNVGRRLSQVSLASDDTIGGYPPDLESDYPRCRDPHHQNPRARI